MGHGRCADGCGGRTCRLRHVPSNNHVPLGASNRQRLRWRSRIRRRGIQHSIWTGRRGSVWHRQQRLHVGLHIVDISGSEGDRQRGVLYDISERHELDLGERNYNRRRRPRPWDNQRNDHHGHAGHRATDWRRRIYDFLGGRGDPFPARRSDHVKAGRSDPANYSQGSGTIVGGTTANSATEAALAAYPGGVVDRVVQLSNGEYEVHYIGVNWPHHIFVNQNFTVVGAN
jgi:hypothetical protein